MKGSFADGGGARRLLGAALVSFGLLAVEGDARAQRGDPPVAPPAESTVPAATVEDARRAIEENRFAEAAEILRPLAERGETEALNLLGDLYSLQEGATWNYPLAISLYRRAAEAGDTYAMLRLSYIYTYGTGVPRDSGEAEHWERRAVEAGSLVALNNLAYNLAVEGRNLDEALSHIRRVVAQEPDDPHFLDTMGWVLYRMGRYAEAIPPLCRSVQLMAHPEIRSHLGDAYWRVGDRVNAHHQWRLALSAYEDAVAQQDPAIGHFVRSDLGLEMRAGLESRLALGLPDSGAAPAIVGEDHGIEATFLDECQIPSA